MTKMTERSSIRSMGPFKASSDTENCIIYQTPEPVFDRLSHQKI